VHRALSFGAMPRFSIVVPTRDRPDLLEFCLESLASQTFADFDVVVSDNPVTAPARHVFDRWARDGWCYLQPESPLPMHENFEAGCARAEGDFVAVVIDKTAIHPSALELADAALSSTPSADIVTWRNEGFTPLDEEGELGLGRFVPAGTATAPLSYDPAAELRSRFENGARRGADPVHYARGKIVFGAYSRALLDRIRAQTGRLFHPLAPDYTAMVPACVLARGAVDVGRPLLVSYNSARSNGRNQTIDPGYARKFIEAVDPSIIGALPVPDVFASMHNVVAYDLVSSAARCPAGSTPELHMPNLLRRIREDLDGVNWTDPAEREEQYARLEAAEAEHGVTPQPQPGATRDLRDVVAGTLAQMPTIERFVYRAARKPSPVFRSPVEAARAADRHYSGAVKS
jgi:cellulose synthase/poly-beta-1,6-N-acetylglucosamine synthase-like glycosyltransferase